MCIFVYESVLLFASVFVCSNPLPLVGAMQPPDAVGGAHSSETNRSLWMSASFSPGQMLGGNICDDSGGKNWKTMEPRHRPNKSRATRKSRARKAQRVVDANFHEECVGGESKNRSRLHGNGGEGEGREGQRWGEGG